MTRRELLSSLALALRKPKMDAAQKLLTAAVAAGKLRAASLYVREGNSILNQGFGAAKADTPFLLASITKPMTATALMHLVDHREVALTDPVRKFIPEFNGGDRQLVTLHMLLTHTSGLPDMLPENEQLRKKHAPLSDFVAATCRTPLLFKPGTQVKYQSMGILLAAEIAQRVTKRPFPEFLRASVFKPLLLSETSLGLGGRAIADTAQCQVEGNDDWNWNSPYWRNLAAPWGGAHSTAEDVSRFVRSFLSPDGRVVRPRTAEMMVLNQNEKLDAPWGIGFSVKPGSFGRRCSAETYGHSGSTGTLCWADPVSSGCFVLLTTWPAEQSSKVLIRPVSDLVSEAVA
ncbi:MAG TPA: serine hydrolase domain-containing protein [Bryobacteraceae bacterium]|nr:serine hydrolase domain-containing protein [Bryobacteraceae bacterium]